MTNYNNENQFTIERHEIAGHSIEIRIRDGEQQLWIDGIRRKILVNDEGYNLYENAYVLPKPSLLEAVEDYLNRENNADCEEE